MQGHYLSTSLAYLKGCGPNKAALLSKDLGLHSFADALTHFPFRYLDRTRFQPIGLISESMPYVQAIGAIEHKEWLPGQGKSRFTVHLRDKSGSMELTWFGNMAWLDEKLKPGQVLIVAGKPIFYKGQPGMSHPDFEIMQPGQQLQPGLSPMYPSSDKLRKAGLDPKGIGKLLKQIIDGLPAPIPENLSEAVLSRYGLIGRDQAFRWIHFPPDSQALQSARFRLKFEELFMAQFRMLQTKARNQTAQPGIPLPQLGPAFHTFYEQHLPFTLTQAQKRVLKEIRADVKSGRQMNRLLQGDVGSGKTVVAVLTALMAHDNGFQTALLAPTEILAQQHFLGISELLMPLGIRVGLLTGSTKKAERTKLHAALQQGEISLLVGTHALLEQEVQFHNLGMAIIDEQHRFGVAQRARLWEKARSTPPHVLVMTATPIPRTLAMTLYGDLDVSVIDELPPGRKNVITIHKGEEVRNEVYRFIRQQVEAGRQIYLVYPLIDESKKLDYKNMLEGFEVFKQHLPDIPADVLHGQMKSADKENAMARFVKGHIKVLVSTTVIEVGVNVPNASVMVIESAERFGLSQLHQLRGRVGRGADQSYCILLTGRQLSTEARERMAVMVATNDGFKIAEKDLELRGPGDLEGTRQSGEMQFKLASLLEDAPVLEQARQAVWHIVERDPDLLDPQHANLLRYLQARERSQGPWSMIS